MESRKRNHDFKIKPMLSEKEKERYSRHLLLEEIGEQGQEKIKNAKVLVGRSRRLRLSGPALPRSGGNRTNRYYGR